MSESKLVQVRFTKPTLNYAKGDVAVLEEDYVEKIVKKYVRKNFEADDRDRYEVLGDAEVNTRSESGAKSSGTTKEPTLAELKSQAVELGVDVSGLRSKADVQKAIDEAQAEES